MRNVVESIASTWNTLAEMVHFLQSILHRIASLQLFAFLIFSNVVSALTPASALALALPSASASASACVPPTSYSALTRSRTTTGPGIRRRNFCFPTFLHAAKYKTKQDVI
ncbi:hypothetical protein D917_06660 [Trichinella nativa]|uniref:Uncharacterized protein n=1 Tax=Trichinella nativa TaxID=6335 RepID=A0A1Y3ERM2_9BILA|nr:hypothetical protein D917_06660 [Trichinella nativa]